MDAGKMRQCDPAVWLHDLGRLHNITQTSEAQVLAAKRSLEFADDADFETHRRHGNGINSTGCGLSLPS